MRCVCMGILFINKILQGVCSQLVHMCIEKITTCTYVYITYICIYVGTYKVLLTVGMQESDQKGISQCFDF